MIDPWILAFSLVTVAATIWMGFRSARSSKSAADFFVAGRSVSVGWNASAISGEYLSAASFMGVAGMVMSSGYDALWYPVCYACGYLFLLLFIAGPLRRFGAYTIPDFAEGRYDSPVFRRIAVVFVLFIGFFYTMPQMKGAGTTLAYVFKDIDFLGQKGLPYWVGVVVVGAVITLNVALGGMKGITLVQAFQYWMKMFAISVPIFVLASVYGGYGRQLEQNSVTLKDTALTPNIARAVAPGAGADELPLPADGVISFDPEAFPAEFSKETSVTSYLSLQGEVKAKAIRLGLGRTTLSLPTPTCPTSMALDAYIQLRLSFSDRFTNYVGRDVLRAGLRNLDTSTVPKPPASASARSLSRYLEQLFATNGLTVVHVSRDSAAVVLTTNLIRFVPAAVGTPATAAPGTGPALEPVAVGALETDPESSGLYYRDGGMRRDFSRWKNLWIDLRGRERRMTVSVAAGTYSLADLLLHYAHSHVWHRGVNQVSGLIAREISGRQISYTQSGPLTRVEFDGHVRRVLADHGITLLHVTREVYKAVPTDSASKYRVVFQEAGSGTVRNQLPAKAPPDSTWLKPFGPLTTKAAKAAAIDGESAKPYALLYTYSLIIALVCGTAGLPHILVRFYTNPDGVAAKRTTMWVMILIGIFYVFPPVFGVMGRNFMPNLYEGVGVNGTDGIVLKLPTVLGERFGPLGSILSGITCAGAFAAFMSTFSGLLVSMTGALAHDVYGRILRPQSTPEQRMRMFKVAAVLIGGIAILLGTLVENFEINFMVGQAFAIAAASYFPLLFMSVWWRGMTTRGAATGMLAGGLLAVAAISLTSWTTFITTQASKFKALGRVEPGWFAALKPYSLSEFWAAHPLLRILGEQPALWAVPLAILLMIVVSRLTRHTVPRDIREKMLVLHAPEALGLRQDYIRDHEGAH